MATESDLAWDDPRLNVGGDTAWRAGCRLLQTWYRQEALGLNTYGPYRRPKGGEVAEAPFVGSTLPLDAPDAANFLDPSILEAAETRLHQKGWGGLVSEDRLRRNLLSSQPLCFNLFGYLKHHPDALLTWVRTITWADEIIEVRIEWAPPRGRHLGGGSAFDALIIYRTAVSRRGFLGIETKYAEDLAEQDIEIADGSMYVSATRRWGHWKAGSDERLRERHLTQLWLNTLLAQSCVLHAEEGFQEGTVVVMTCAADAAALEATTEVRACLHDPNQWLRWQPYEDLLDAVAEHEEIEDWADRFRQRYLDFTPVAEHLAPDDPRRTPPPDRAREITTWLPNGAWIMPNGPDGPMFFVPSDLASVVRVAPAVVTLAFYYGSGKGWHATFPISDLVSDTGSPRFIPSLDTDFMLSTANLPSPSCT